VTESLPSRPALAAPVSGFAAFVMARVLDDALPARIVGLQRQAESGRLHPDLLAELVQQWSTIREAGRQWAEQRAAADGSTAAQATAAPATLSEIDTARAADLLGVTPNRVRQLVREGLLPGRKISRTWLVDMTAIEMRREINRGHF